MEKIYHKRGDTQAFRRSRQFWVTSIPPAV
jgi:hypothetical protein